MNVRKSECDSDLSGERPSDDAEASSAAHPIRHERDLFPPPIEPRYFGTGNYDSGGTHTGNFALGELNRQGGYGTFTDAGGRGSAALLGEESGEARQADAEDHADHE